jgi:hypothetical protein
MGYIGITGVAYETLKTLGKIGTCLQMFLGVDDSHMILREIKKIHMINIGQRVETGI